MFPTRNSLASVFTGNHPRTSRSRGGGTASASRSGHLALDISLWTWRQLLNMGYDARFIGGRAGRYGDGHAWVEYFQDGKCFLLEPLCCRVGYTMPRLSTLTYEPRMSVSWDGKVLRYFSHKKPTSGVRWPILLFLIPEYLVFWTFFWFRNVFRLPLIAWKVIGKNVFKRENWRLPGDRER